MTFAPDVVRDWSGMNSQVERGTVREMVHTIAFRAGVLERILQEPVLGGLEIRADELVHVQLLQRQIDDLRRYLSLPSAEPERKKGKWEYPRKFGHAHLLGKCSVCGQYEGAEWIVLDNPNFCPNCGADMRGE